LYNKISIGYHGRFLKKQKIIITKNFFYLYFAEKETILFIDSHIWFIYNKIKPYTVDIEKNFIKAQAL